MENFRTIIVLALVGLPFVTAVNPWRELIPDGKEAVYEYQALVKAGTHIPHSFASTFILNGKLHVQTDPVSGLLLRLVDLTYTVDNGKESEIRETAKFPITGNLSSLQNTFKITHSESGKATGITTEENDLEFSVSMKKAIGSIMQLDLQNIRLDSDKSGMFSTEEMSPFGGGIVWYNVLPEGDTLTIHKMHEIKTSHHLYQYMVLKGEPNYCGKYYEDPVSHNSQKSYTIVKKPEGHALTRFESNGGIYLQPFQANSVALYIIVNQTFNLQAISAQQKAMYINKERHHDNLEERLTGAPYEMVSDTQTLLPVVEQMLHEIVDYMAQSDNLITERPNFKQGQLINRIQKVLVHFSFPLLKTMHDTLLSKTEENDLKMLDMFYNLLPLIGTHDSLVFIVNLIQENQLKESVASNMLKKMPFHVRKPSEQLIHDVDILLHLPQVSWSLQKLAILSFSNILNKLYAHKHIHFHDHFHAHSDMHHMVHSSVEVQSEVDVFEKYMIDFVNIIKTSQKREEQLVYLEAIHNMKVKHVIRYLEKAVKGEWWNDNQLRMMAMWAVAPVAMKDPEKVIELYWPIFTDRMLRTKLRITAFFVIMKARPPLSQLINVYWFMQNEPHQTLYQFYYSYIKALSETTDPCSSKLKLFAKQILIYTPMPYLPSLTGYHWMGYLDTKYNFGDDSDFYFINAPNTQIFSGAIHTQAMSIHQTPTTVYVKVTGLDGALLQNMKLTITTAMEFFNCDEILKYIIRIPADSRIQIEFTLLHYNQVVEFLYYDSASLNIKTMWSMLKIWCEDEFSSTKRYIDLQYELFLQTYIPTEIGFPAVFEILVPSVAFGSINAKRTVKDKTTSVHIVSKHKIWSHGSFGVSFHNPIILAWQGVNRYMSRNSILNIDMDVSVNRQMMVLSWKGRNNSFEANGHVANMVFVKDYLHNNILKRTSPNSKNWVVVAGDDKFKSEPVFIDGFTIYDADNAIADRKLWYDEQAERNAWMCTCARMFNFIHHHRYIMLQPDVVTRGIMRKIKGGGSDEISLRLNLVNHDTSPNLPTMKLNTRGTFTTFTTTDESEPVGTYKFNAVLDINNGHTANSLKMQITRTSSGETDFNMCVEGNEKYTDDGITGALNIAFSQPAEGKCSDNNSVVHISMLGKQLPKDVQFSENYDVCLKNVWSPIRHMKPYSCYATLSSIRNYTIDIKAMNVPKNVQGLWTHLTKEIVLTDITSFESAHSENLGENDYRVHLHYPFNEDLLDVDVYTSGNSFKLNHIDRKYLTFKGVYPGNTQYSNMHRIMHNLGLNHVCSVKNNHVINVKHQVKDEVTADWSLLFGDSAQNSKYGVWVKIIDNKLAVKIMHNMQLLVILPHKKKFTVTLDGKMIEDDVRSYSQDWFHFDLLDNSELFVFLSKYIGHHIVYNGDQLQMEIPNMDMQLVGLCFDVAN